MDIRKLIQRYGLEYIGRFYSKYRAIVVENEDPDKQGKLYIYIPSIFNGIKAWAYPVGLYGGPNTGFKYLTPPKGATVWVTFEKGDPLYPVWEYHGWFKDQLPEELDDVNTLGFVTPNGNKVYLKDVDGVLHINLQDGMEFVVNEGTTIKIEGENTIINGGLNRGLVNIAQVESLAVAIMKDLTGLSSGTNLSKWMGQEMPKMEDKKVTH